MIPCFQGSEPPPCGAALSQCHNAENLISTEVLPRYIARPMPVNAAVPILGILTAARIPQTSPATPYARPSLSKNDFTDVDNWSFE